MTRQHGSSLAQATPGHPTDRPPSEADAYYRHERREVEPLLPPRAERVLDVGCGAGTTLAWLKQRYPAALTIGLEGNPAVRGALERNADIAHIVDLNNDIPDVGAPDLILCLDVLEHLVYPERTLARLAGILAPHGTIVVSLPNVAHLSVALPLAVLGEFRYRDAGILDRTHLHFFVQRSAVELFQQAGLVVEHGLRLGFAGARSWIADRMTLGLMKNRLTKQYVLAGRPLNGDLRQRPISWQRG